MNQRKFVIKIIYDDPTITGKCKGSQQVPIYVKPLLYIKKIYGDQLERWYSITYIDKAKIWKFKKSCEKALEKINKCHINKTYLKKHTLEIIEITDSQILRKIKLEKLKNN